MFRGGALPQARATTMFAVVFGLGVGCTKSNPNYEDAEDGSGAEASEGTTAVSSTTTTSGTTPTTSTTDGASTEPASGTSTGAAPRGWRQRITVAALSIPDPEVITDVPVLVALTPEVFAYGDAAPGGSDLRFHPVGEPTVVLPHEIAAYDETGTSLVWVRLPEVDVGEGTAFVMAYGYEDPAPAEPPQDVWSNGFVAVYHFEDAVGSPQTLADSTLHENDASIDAAEATVSSRWGKALSVEQATEAVAPHTASLTLDHLSVSAWVQPTTTAPLSTLHREVVSKALNYRLIAVHFDDPNAPFINIRSNTGVNDNAAWGQPLTVSSWTHLAGSYDGARLRFSVDGVEVDVEASTITVNQSVTPLTLGNNYAGLIDEVRLAAVPRTASWVAFEHASMDGTLLSFAQPQASDP